MNMQKKPHVGSLSIPLLVLQNPSPRGTSTYANVAIATKTGGGVKLGPNPKS